MGGNNKYQLVQWVLRTDLVWILHSYSIVYDSALLWAQWMVTILLTFT